MIKIQELSNYQIVTIAVTLLGGDSEHVDSEDIALKVDELAPGKFNWRKYPNRIDLVTVRVALDDAKKEKNQKLLIGNHVRGWMLNANGLRWIVSLNKNEPPIDLPLGKVISKIFSSLQAEKERLITTIAYQQYIDGKITDISERDFFEFTRTNEYFKAKAQERRFTIIENAVINHKELTATWEYLKDKFLKENSNND